MEHSRVTKAQFHFNRCMSLSVYESMNVYQHCTYHTGYSLTVYIPATIFLLLKDSEEQGRRKRFQRAFISLSIYTQWHAWECAMRMSTGKDGNAYSAIVARESGKQHYGSEERRCMWTLQSIEGLCCFWLDKWHKEAQKVALIFYITIRVCNSNSIVFLHHKSKSYILLMAYQFPLVRLIVFQCKERYCDLNLLKFFLLTY